MSTFASFLSTFLLLTCLIRSRLLDILLEVNNSAQIPPERRIDLALEPPSDPVAPSLPIDHQNGDRKELALKKLKELLSSVPHSSYSTTKDSHPSLVTDLSAPDGESHPANFLTADDIDAYIHAVDVTLGLHPEDHPPPVSAARTHAAMHPQLKNPTSVTNWLRKHKPNIFLQDSEAQHHGGDGDDDAGGHTGGRKSRGGARGERGGRASTRGKKATAAARSSAAADHEGAGDDDGDYGTPVGRGGKRKRDDDGGYRPKGSTSRPTKKKRKSEGDGTPTVRKSKKDSLPAASKDD